MRAIEARADSLLLGFGDADPEVFHQYGDPVAERPDADFDVASVRRVADSVLDEVRDHRLEPFGIGPNERRIGTYQLHRVFRRRSGKAGDDAAYQGRHVHELEHEVEAP